MNAARDGAVEQAGRMRAVLTAYRWVAFVGPRTTTAMRRAGRKRPLQMIAAVPFSPLPRGRGRARARRRR